MTTLLQLTDLELLRHFIMSASLGFSDRAGDLEYWRGSLIDTALQHPFLMRAILAASALHLARLQPDRRQHFLVTAASHQDMALPAQRHVVSDMTHGNCHAVVSFANLTAAHSLACPRRQGDSGGDLSLEEATEWLYLLRGARSIKRVAEEEVIKGPMYFHSVFPSMPVDTRWNPEDDRLAVLEDLCDGEDLEETDAYRTTLGLLRQSLALPWSPLEEIGIKASICFWVERVPQKYLDLLQDNRAEALILLAHLCILFKRGEASWYIQGAAERILKVIKDLLEDEWAAWIAWPMEIVYRLP